jgi:hypothetical protein
MFRFSFWLGFLTLLLSPMSATAQFTPSLVPPNPLYQHPAYGYQLNFGAVVPTAFGRTFVGLTVPLTRAPQIFSPNMGYSAPYSWSGGRVPSTGYMSGSSGRYDSYSVQRDFEKAQRDATLNWRSPGAAKNLISNQWAYEKIGMTPAAAAAAAKDTSDSLINALHARTETEVASGEALNHILAATVVAEAKGGKGVSAFLPPQVLGDVRFAGKAGEALDLLRQAGRLPFPAAFDTPELRPMRDAIERDFAALAAPMLLGKPYESGKLAILEADLKKTELASPVVIREQSFEDAIATRRFLNQLAGLTRTLRAGGTTGLLNPAWATDGTSVADLVKHMAKYKIQFGAAPEGNEPSYLALHRALTTYLFVLSQPKKGR